MYGLFSVSDIFFLSRLAFFLNSNNVWRFACVCLNLWLMECKFVWVSGVSLCEWSNVFLCVCFSVVSWFSRVYFCFVNIPVVSFFQNMWWWVYFIIFVSSCGIYSVLNCLLLMCVISLYRRPLGESKLRYASLAKTLSRYGKKRYPKRPQTASDVIRAFQDPKVSISYGKNLRKNKDFYIDTVINEPRNNVKESHFTLFASHQAIDLIQKHIPVNERHYLMDGTFDVTPLGYYQLLVIHIRYQNEVSFLRICDRLNACLNDRMSVCYACLTVRMSAFPPVCPYVWITHVYSQLLF